MLTKEKIIEAVNNMPGTFSVDDLLDRIMLLQKVEKGIEQSDAGQTFSTNEAKECLSKLLK